MIERQKPARRETNDIMMSASAKLRLLSRAPPTGTAIMAPSYTYTHMFSYQAILHRTSFRHGLAGATRPLWKTPLLAPSKPRVAFWPPRPLSNPVATKRVPSAIVRLTGTGIAGAGLGLSLYANLQKLNCERTSNHFPPP